MNALLRRYRDAIARLRAAGERLFCYACPHCMRAIRTPCPSREGEVWDSLAQCPHCSALHFIVKRRRGQITVYADPPGRAEGQEVPHVH